VTDFVSAKQHHSVDNTTTLTLEERFALCAKVLKAPNQLVHSCCRALLQKMKVVKQRDFMSHVLQEGSAQESFWQSTHKEKIIMAAMEQFDCTK